MNLFKNHKKNNFSEKLQEEVESLRQEHKDKLRERLKKYYLSDSEIDKLFIIIKKSEEKIEKIKYSIDYSKAGQEELFEMAEKIKKVQKNLKDNFEKELNKLLKNKYIKAKKFLKDN